LILYPIILLPACLIYVVKNKRDRVKGLLVFSAAFICCTLIGILAPFMIFNWSTVGFGGLISAQASRAPNGGIAPLSIFNYLLWNGVSTLGPINVAALYSATPLRYFWVLAIAYAAWYLDVKRQPKAFAELLLEFLLIYVVYCLTAPWVSEQMIEPLLIMLLFVTAAMGPKRIGLPYILGSALALAFIALHVPMTAFISPVSNFDSSPIVESVKPAIPWVVAIFCVYLAYELTLLVKRIDLQFDLQQKTHTVKRIVKQ
jgi:hypothetical protein